MNNLATNNFDDVNCFRKNTLESKSNLMMVDLLPLERSEDLSFVESLLKEYYEKTDSAIAQRILANWPASAKSFVKVMN